MQGSKNINQKKPNWGKKGAGNVVQGQGTTTVGTSSGSVAAVASTQGQKGGGQKKGRRPCMACGGQHAFRKCPQWVKMQALLDEKQPKQKKQGN